MGPHARLFTARPANSTGEQLLASLFDALWVRYREVVPYVRNYEEIAARYGAPFVNDHIAFRTLGSQRPMTGIPCLGRLFMALGYQPVACYNFADKHLSAIHFQHRRADFPKLFVSELKTWELPAEPRNALRECAEQHESWAELEQLAELHELGSSPPDSVELRLVTENLCGWFRRPWPAPSLEGVQLVNQASQYGAWTMLHGYRVNHFTSLINSHQVPELDSLEKTMAALREAGVPTKDSIEGAPGSILRQSATAAAECEVDVTIAGKPATTSWTYAYFELAERGLVTDPTTGQQHRFDGFLGEQATQLFEMTRSIPN
ncbi:MAG: DUF1338 domain-containing protein [Planctomycetales bacterium]|nr:DUF1338 domain-containing protein [Planctomycetales bacterium]